MSTPFNRAPIVHFLMRVPRVTFVEGQRPGGSHSHAINTIDAHSEVIQASGHVAIAKFGAPNPRVERLQKQIQEQVPTYLILVFKRGGKFIGFKSLISAIRLGTPTAEIKNSAPSYYREFSYSAGLWFVVEGPLQICDLTKLQLASNKKPLLEVLSASRTPSMLVETVGYVPLRRSTHRSSSTK